MSELANSKESDDPEYTRQIITIRKSAYEALRQIAFQDSKRRLKIGDVIEAYFMLALENTPAPEIDRMLEELRKGARKQGRKALAMKRISSLTAEQRAELEAWLDKQQARDTYEAGKTLDLGTVAGKLKDLPDDTSGKS